MKKQPLIKSRKISTDRIESYLYTSIETDNWLLARHVMTVGTFQKGRQGILSELVDTKHKDEFSGTCHFKKDEKAICFTSYTVKTKPKDKKTLLFCQHPVLYMGKQLLMVRTNQRS